MRDDNCEEQMLPLVLLSLSLAAYTVKDPAFATSWYLKSGNGSTLDVMKLWEQNVMGKGVTVLVLDDSVDFDNPDLQNKEYEMCSHNYMTGGRNVAPTKEEQWHGTPIASTIAGTHNDWCNAGVAPDVTVAARVVVFDGTTTEDIINSLTDNVENVDIINGSWIIDTCAQSNDTACCTLMVDQYISMALEEAATKGRNGKGALVVFMAGDQAQYEYADTNLSPLTRSPYAFTITSAGRNMGCVSTTTRGKSVFMAAPGVATNTDDNDCIHSSSTNVTVDKTTGLSSYEYECASLGGTDTAAALFSGSLALILQQNPNLTVGDLRHILAYTATPIAAGDKVNVNERMAKISPLSYNSETGFGLINLAKAANVSSLWSSCGEYVSSTGKINEVKISSGCTQSAGVISLPANGQLVANIFMKTSEAVLIESLVVGVGGVAGESVCIDVQADERFRTGSTITSGYTKPDSTTSTVEDWSTILCTQASDDTSSEKLELLTYEYAGLPSSGVWSVRVRNTGTKSISIPASSISLTARGFPNYVEIGSPTPVYNTANCLEYIKIVPVVNYPENNELYNKELRAYLVVDDALVLMTEKDGSTPLSVSVNSSEVLLPWHDEYLSKCGIQLTDKCVSVSMRVLLVSDDYVDTILNIPCSSCHSILSAAANVENCQNTPAEEEEEIIPSPPIPEEEECEPVPEEECVEETIPPATYPPDEEAVDGFTVQKMTLASVVGVLAAIIVGMAV